MEDILEQYLVVLIVIGHTSLHLLHCELSNL